MKKIVAFVSSLILVIPSFGQDAPKDKNKTQGVSKVTPQNVKSAPATTKAKPSSAPLKNSNTQKSPSNVKNSGK